MQEMVVRVGEPIPDFDVEAYHGNQIEKMKLSDHKGKWLVLAFYPADFTFVCPTELEELADYHPKFQDMGAEILSVSTDTVYVHKAWHDTSPAVGKIRYPMVADPSGAVCRAFGTFLEDKGISLRATFIVDPEGVLRAYEIHDNSIGRSAAEILRKAQAAKYVQEHGGEVCPASWQPGEETLKPGLDLVGKI